MPFDMSMCLGSKAFMKSDKIAINFLCSTESQNQKNLLMRKMLRAYDRKMVGT